MISRHTIYPVVFAILILAACKKAPPPDAVCTYEPLPATADVPSGQGGIMAQASTDTYFYAVDETGKQLGSAHVNGTLALKPGSYRLKVNNSLHPAAVQSKTLTKCSTGAVLVSAATDEYYYILDSAATQLSSAHVAAALSLFPGNYQVRLNNSLASATVQPGATVELKPGILNVEAPTDEYYYVFDSTARQLASSHVGKPIGLFAAGYSVKINNSESKAEVRAGQTSTLAAGTLVVDGATDEYYYVFNPAGTQLASAHLGRPLALFPGSYNVKLNNSVMPATVAAAVPADIKTGSITLQGPTDEYYYVYDRAGTQLASSHLGRPLSFMPGDYTAKLNNVAVPVHAEAGRANDYQAGTVTVKSSGSEYYYVLDSAGTQLASKQLNQPISLPAGKYSVKVGNNARPVAVAAGQSLVVNW